MRRFIANANKTKSTAATLAAASTTAYAVRPNKTTPTLQVHELAILVNNHVASIGNGERCSYENDYLRLTEFGIMDKSSETKRNCTTHIRNELSRALLGYGRHSSITFLMNKERNVLKDFLLGHYSSLEEASLIANTHGWDKYDALDGLTDELFFSSTSERMTDVKKDHQVLFDADVAQKLQNNLPCPPSSVVIDLSSPCSSPLSSPLGPSSFLHAPNLQESISLSSTSTSFKRKIKEEGCQSSPAHSSAASQDQHS